MSELHLELGELHAAGVDLTNPTAIRDHATRRGFTLTVECLALDPNDLQDFVAEWFPKAVAA